MIGNILKAINKESLLFVCLSRLSTRGKREAGAESIGTKKPLLGPDYMRRAGPVSRAGLSLPGSQHVC